MKLTAKKITEIIDESVKLNESNLDTEIWWDDDIVQFVKMSNPSVLKSTIASVVTKYNEKRKGDGFP